MVHELGDEAAKILAGGVKLGDRLEDGGDVGAENGARKGFDLGSGDEAEDAEDVRLVDLAAGEGDDLVERGFGVAHAAVGAAGDGEEGVVGDLDPLGVADLAELADDVGVGDAPEVEALAAREHGAEHLVRLGRGEDELDEFRRLFERLQQRVEGRGGEHVHFVDVEDAVAAFDRGVLHERKDAVVHVLDLVVRGAVDFRHVERRTGHDGLAGVARAAGHGRRAFFAVERLREDAGERGLARAAGAGEKIRLGDAAAFDGVAERADDVVLPDDLFEGLRAPFAGDDFVGHGSEREKGEGIRRKGKGGGRPWCPSPSSRGRRFRRGGGRTRPSPSRRARRRALRRGP